MGLLSKIKDDLIPNELKSGSAAKKAIRNLIPNELADVAVKAAPFVAMIPGQQGTAALMRGLGRFDQRGSMSDALKQGLGTYAFGKMASPLTSKIPGIEGSYEGLGGIKDFGIDAYEALKTGGTNLKDTVLEKVQDGDYLEKAEKKIKELVSGDKDKKGGIWDIFSDPKKTIPMAMLGTWIKEKYFPDDIPEDPALKQYKDYMRRRGQDVSSYLNQYGPIDFRRDPEANPYTAEEIQQFVELNTPEYKDYNKGGRVSLALGGNGAPLPDDPTKPVNPWAPKPIKPLGIKSLDAGAQDITYEGDQRMAGGEYNRVLELLEKIRENIPLSDEEKMELQGLIKTLTAQGMDVEKLMSQGPQGIQMAAQGGRIGYAFGTKTGVALPDPNRIVPEGDLKDTLLNIFTNKLAGRKQMIPDPNRIVPEGDLKDNLLNIFTNKLAGREQVQPLLGGQTRKRESFMGNLIPQSFQNLELQKEYEDYIASGGDLEYDDWIVARQEAAQGGRIGYAGGGLGMDEIATEFKRQFGYDMSLANPDVIKEFIKKMKEESGEYDDVPMAQGGRVGARLGGDMEELSMRETIDTPEGIETLQETETMKMAGGGARGWRAQMLAEELAEEKYGKEFYDLTQQQQYEIYTIALDMVDSQGMAKGGRARLYGGGETAQAAGIMGNLPVRKNSVGVEELDLRETGGFIPPVGVKEKADDIPAMLSNNEFVWTADAVRAAGGGSVNKGAQILYDQMKQLEGQVT